MAQINGHLVIIGGAEVRDPEGDKPILSHVVALSGGSGAQILLLTTATQEAEELGAIYTQAFLDCGAGGIATLHIDDAAMANDPQVASQLGRANGIFMTGGNQSRLAGVLGGSAAARAMHQALARGACIAGTSAGAAAISRYMVAGGESGTLPKKGMARMAMGLGFLPRVIIDQHFSERQRLGRLMSAVAELPNLPGLGIDENTAVVVQPDQGLTILGQGTVTLVDGRHVQIANRSEVQEGEFLALSHVDLHVLPNGFCLNPAEPASKLEALIKTVVAAT